MRSERLLGRREDIKSSEVVDLRLCGVDGVLEPIEASIEPLRLLAPAIVRHHREVTEVACKARFLPLDEVDLVTETQRNATADDLHLSSHFDETRVRLLQPRVCV